jgi:hypothetical protein
MLVLFAPRRASISTAELGAGIGLLVTTLAFEVMVGGAELGYGAIIGFVAAALVVGLALAGLSRPVLARNRLVPMAACAGYVLLVVVPWWDVLPRDVQSALRFVPAPLSWTTIAGVLLAVHLLRSWAYEERAGWLVGLPLAMLALAVVDLIRVEDVTWGGGAVVALCLALGIFGLLEQRGRLVLPEILRVDRLGADPGGEAGR